MTEKEVVERFFAGETFDSAGGRYVTGQYGDRGRVLYECVDGGTGRPRYVTLAEVVE